MRRPALALSLRTVGLVLGLVLLRIAHPSLPRCCPRIADLAYVGAHSGARVRVGVGMSWRCLYPGTTLTA